MGTESYSHLQVTKVGAGELHVPKYHRRPSPQPPFRGQLRAGTPQASPDVGHDDGDAKGAISPKATPQHCMETGL